MKEDEGLTMEKFLDTFITTFEQNNYSDFIDTTLEESKNTFRICYFPSDSYLKVVNGPIQKSSRWVKSTNSLEVINSLLRIQKETINKILDMNKMEEI